MISFYNFNLWQPWPAQRRPWVWDTHKKKADFGRGIWVDFEFLVCHWIINAAIDFLQQKPAARNEGTKINQKIKLQPETEDGDGDGVGDGGTLLTRFGATNLLPFAGGVQRKVLGSTLRSWHLLLAPEQHNLAKRQSTPFQTHSIFICQPVQEKRKKLRKKVGKSFRLSKPNKVQTAAENNVST